MTKALQNDLIELDDWYREETKWQIADKSRPGGSINSPGYTNPEGLRRGGVLQLLARIVTDIRTGDW